MDAPTRALASAAEPPAGPLPKSPHHGGNPWSLTLAALGVVYGDIGTSPLYAFQIALAGTGHSPPTSQDVLGIVSLIFWALMAMVTLKYVIFVLRADNEGEGGILALLSLVTSGRVSQDIGLPVLSCSGSSVRRCCAGTGSSRRLSPCSRPWRVSSSLPRPSNISSCRSRSQS